MLLSRRKRKRSAASPPARLGRRTIRSETYNWRHRQCRERQRDREKAIVGPRMAATVAVFRALGLAGVEFIDENGGGPGVRCKIGSGKKVGSVAQSDHPRHFKTQWDIG
jgi:hypothetical protein